MAGVPSVNQPLQTPRYEGDAAMATLLRSSGSRLDINKLRHLVAGVVSAPRGERPKDWMTLVAPSPDPALERQLAALEEEMAAGRPAELAARGVDRGLRLAALRKELVRQNLDGFLIPRADEFQG